MDDYQWRVGVGMVFLVCYVAMILWSTRNYIERANDRWLRAHQAAFLARLASEEPAASSADPELFLHLDVALRELVPGPEKKRSWWPLHRSDWIGAESIAAWIRLHEAQRLEAWLLPMPAVEARFARAMGQVDELSATRQSAWQGRWIELRNLPGDRGRTSPVEPAGEPGSSGCGWRWPWSRPTAPAAGQPAIPPPAAPPAVARAATGREREDAWRAELSQLLAELFNARDATYNQLVSLFGKAAWIYVVASIAGAALIASDYGFVFLAGFVGGLVSRMQRLVYAQGHPTAYGTSWVPLFLAPLLGGLAAWGGLHVLALLQALKLVQLDQVLNPDNFRGTANAATLGLCVLLGFSERFFNQIGNQAEKVIGSSDQGTAATSGFPGPLYLRVGEAAGQNQEAPPRT
jgi:hypothetical protein